MRDHPIGARARWVLHSARGPVRPDVPCRGAGRAACDSCRARRRVERVIRALAVWGCLGKPAAAEVPARGGKLHRLWRASRRLGRNKGDRQAEEIGRVAGLWGQPRVLCKCASAPSSFPPAASSTAPAIIHTICIRIRLLCSGSTESSAPTHLDCIADALFLTWLFSSGQHQARVRRHLLRGWLR